MILIENSSSIEEEDLLAEGWFKPILKAALVAWKKRSAKEGKRAFHSARVEDVLDKAQEDLINIEQKIGRKLTPFNKPATNVIRQYKNVPESSFNEAIENMEILLKEEIKELCMLIEKNIDPELLKEGQLDPVRIDEWVSKLIPKSWIKKVLQSLVNLRYRIGQKIGGKGPKKEPIKPDNKTDQEWADKSDPLAIGRKDRLELGQVSKKFNQKTGKWEPLSADEYIGGWDPGPPRIIKGNKEDWMPD
ncbi:MAG: hypothetical protein CL489_05870 [Acidobacteria bacterium]|nr:hypothetical protein [Acidobacteriota bacterium]